MCFGYAYGNQQTETSSNWESQETMTIQGYWSKLALHTLLQLEKSMDG
jgi:hypothetical protein